MGNKSADAPDFMGAARATADSAQAAMDRQTIANRMNTTFGDGSTINYGRKREDDAAFSQRQQAARQSAYDSAYREYLARPNMTGMSMQQREQMAKSVADKAAGDAALKLERLPDEWTQTQTLSPEAKAALEAQQRIGRGRSELAESLLGRAKSELSTPMDWTGAPQIGNGMEARQRAEDALYQRQASRLDPMWNQRQQSMQQQLANQGVEAGSEAYRNAMDDFSRGRNDAYDTAMQGAISGGGNEMSRQFGQDMQGRQQWIAEQLQRRGMTMNEINAALSGQQVGMPNMPMANNTAGAAQGANFLGAANMQGQFGLQNQQMQNQMTQGLMQGGMGMATGFFGF